MTVQSVCLGWHWQPYAYSRTADDTDGAPVKPLPADLADAGPPGRRRHVRPGRRRRATRPTRRSSTSTRRAPASACTRTARSRPTPRSSRSASATRACSGWPASTGAPARSPTSCCARATCSCSAAPTGASTTACRRCSTAPGRTTRPAAGPAQHHDPGDRAVTGSTVHLTDVAGGVGIMWPVRPFEELVREHGAVVMRVCRALLPAGRRRRRLVGDVPVGAAGVPAAAPGQQRARLARDDRPPQGARPAARPRPAAPCRPPTCPTRGTTDPEPADDDLRAAVAALPDKQRAAVVLHHLAGLPYADVAAELGGTRRRGPARRRRRHRPPARRALEPRRRCPMTDAARPHRRAGRGRRSPGCTPTWPDGPTAEGLLDVAYRTVDSPLGALLLAATPAGLVRVAFAGEGHDDVLAALAVGDQPAHPRRAGPPRPRRPPARRVLRRPPPHVRRRRRPAAGVRLPPRRPASTCATIPFGATESYATVARAAGSPERRARGRHGVRHEPGARRRAVPPRRAQRRHRSASTAAASAAKRTLLALEAA